MLEMVLPLKMGWSSQPRIKTMIYGVKTVLSVTKERHGIPTATVLMLMASISLATTPPMLMVWTGVPGEVIITPSRLLKWNYVKYMYLYKHARTQDTKYVLYFTLKLYLYMQCMLSTKCLNLHTCYAEAHFCVKVYTIHHGANLHSLVVIHICCTCSLQSLSDHTSLFSVAICTLQPFVRQCRISHEWFQ